MPRAWRAARTSASRRAGERGDPAVAHAHPLEPAQIDRVEPRAGAGLGDLELGERELADVMEEPRIDPGQLVDALGGHAELERARDLEQPIG